MKASFYLPVIALYCISINAQAPAISYSTPQNYTVGTAITPLTPTNTGGAVPALYGEVITFAGSGEEGDDDGIGSAATFNSPCRIATDALGNVYIAEQYNHKIRKITPSGVVSTLAGTGNFGATDGPGNLASFQYPFALTVDAAGNVVVADTGNRKIRKITPEGIVSTIAGSGITGSADGPASSASFDNPCDVAVDQQGNIYIADHDNNKIRKLSTDGIVSTFAGSGSTGVVNGPGNVASFNQPFGLVVDPQDNVYVADRMNRKVRKITSDGVVSTFAGSGSYGSADGSSTTASFSNLTDMEFDIVGNMYIADSGNHKIRKISVDGMVSTFAGTGTVGSADGPNNEATFNFPAGIAIVADGNLFVNDIAANIIRKITPASYSISPTLPPGLTFDSATGVISGTPTAEIPPTTFTVTASNASGSSTTTVVIQTSVLGISEFEKAGLVLFPNPAKDFINLYYADGSAPLIDRLVITDLGGKIVADDKGNVQSVGNLAAGLYLIEVAIGGRSFKVKFWKE